jgi:hypothetical protein
MLITLAFFQVSDDKAAALMRQLETLAKEMASQGESSPTPPGNTDPIPEAVPASEATPATDPSESPSEETAAFNYEWIRARLSEIRLRKPELDLVPLFAQFGAKRLAEVSPNDYQALFAAAKDQI